MNEVITPISYGELIDKITILEIKSERITAADKLENIQHELARLKETWDNHSNNKADISHLWQKLREINGKLWNIEDDIRECERKADFGDMFIELARSVYFTNDERSRVKYEINQILGSAIVEEKSYADYARSESNI